VEFQPFIPVLVLHHDLQQIAIWFSCLMEFEIQQFWGLVCSQPTNADVFFAHGEQAIATEL